MKAFQWTWPGEGEGGVERRLGMANGLGGEREVNGVDTEYGEWSGH